VTIALAQSITGNGATLTLNGVVSGALLTLQDSFYRTSGGAVAEAPPTDTQGAWSVSSAGVPGAQGNGNYSGCGIFHQANAAAGTHTVTPQTSADNNATLCEWVGCKAASPLDASASASTNNFAGTSQVTGTTAVTAQNDELVLIAFGLACPVGVTDVGFTDPVSGFTTQQKVSNDASDIATFHAYKIISATGTQSATFNWTDTEATQFCGAAIATFKAADSSAPIYGNGQDATHLHDGRRNVSAMYSMQGWSPVGAEKWFADELEQAAGTPPTFQAAWARNSNSIIQPGLH
jgi:hypothetical protein